MKILILILLPWQLVVFPIFSWGKAVFLFKCPEKAGIIPEAVLKMDLADGLSGENSVFAGMKPFFQDILMKRDSHVILENMGYMVFAHIEKRGQGIQAQIFPQMAVDVVTKV